MNLRLFVTRFWIVLALFAAPLAVAQDAAADLKALVGRVQTKLRSGQRSAADLAPDLAAFDALVEKYKGQKTDDAAQVAMMRAMLYVEVLDDTERGKALLTQLQADYPGTRPAAAADRMLGALADEATRQAARAALIGKAAPELHFKWSSREGLTKLSDLRGKVVVIDFWATWCGPCIASFPQVRELVAHYKGADFVVLGVTSIQGRVVNLEPAPIDTKGDPAKEMGLMAAFMKAKDMTWPVAFSDEPVFNPDYGVNGIPHMAIVAPDGTVRHNGMHPATPHAEKAEKIDALLKEFGLKIPPR